ncbi:pro-thyrotropin-releasing hormone [Stigmatopora nigra]
MKSTCLLFLACVLLCNLVMVCRAQSISAEEEAGPSTVDDLLLQRAQKLLLLRSILTSMPDQDGARLSKRQHPGRRSSEDMEDGGDEDEDYLEVERRQHPGKRSTVARVWEPLVMVEASKRQHPGKRYSVVTRIRRQHPGKRRPDDDDDMEEDDEDIPLLDKRQHPGKRFWGAPQLTTTGPCEGVSDPVMCVKTNLLLDFFDAKPADEKRQHPGRRFASDIRGE